MPCEPGLGLGNLGCVTPKPGLGLGVTWAGAGHTHISPLPRPTTHSHGMHPTRRHRETTPVPSVLAGGARPKSWARRAGGRSSSAAARGEPALALRDARTLIR